MRVAILAIAICSILELSGAANAQSPARQTTLIPPQELAPALQSLVKARQFQIVYSSDLLANRQTRGVSGELTLDEALNKLLEGTGLTFQYLDSKTVAIRAKPTADASKVDAIHLARVGTDATAEDSNAEAEKDSSADTSEDQSSKGIPEMLVKGSRTSNIDIQRTEDDVQPYVVFTSEDIQRSMAGSLDQFLMIRLPMNASYYTADVILGLPTTGNTSSIDLRGLGSAQTLILVNGRRVPGVGTSATLSQADINGIPMSSVERIEILPSTAGGIYGGGATGV